MIVEKPKRKVFSYIQDLSDVPQKVFPLLCPVQEMKWVPNWNPTLVLSESGVIEERCIFITDDGEHRSIWFVSEYSPELFMIDLIRLIPDHSVSKMHIQLEDGAAGRCLATISCEYTAIAPEGEAFLETRTQAWYREFMQRWQDALNHYLEHGS